MRYYTKQEMEASAACLTLTVIRPAVAKDKKELFPILVLIHGGELDSGWSHCSCVDRR